VPYTKYNDPWVDADSATGGGDETTPLVAAALDNIEQGVSDAVTAVEAHLADPADAHDASAISVLDAGANFTATEVEAALAELADRLDNLDTSTPAGTAFPGSPSDGDEFVLVDSTTNPTYQWRFRYNAGSSSTYKWEFVGGSAKLVRVDTDESTGSTSYTDLTTAVTFTVPAPGDYEVWHGGNFYNETSDKHSYQTLHYNGSADTAQETYSKLNALQYVAAAVPRNITVTSASAVKLVHKAEGAPPSTGHFPQRWMRVLPTRVS